MTEELRNKVIDRVIDFMTDNTKETHKRIASALIEELKQVKNNAVLPLVSNPVKNAIAEVDKQEKMHIIYTINGKVKQAFKKWNFAKCEEVLKRLGAEYWEIG